ncbi:hypothetical protein ACWCPF_25330 [Streptomyces sp. NPDC001858]
MDARPASEAAGAGPPWCRLTVIPPYTLKIRSGLSAAIFSTCGPVPVSETLQSSVF